MALFGNNKEKKDYDPYAPKRTGIMLVLSTMWREAISLITLNFMFDLFFLPAFFAYLGFVFIDDFLPFFILLCCMVVLMAATLPAAVTALCRITTSMVRDENFFLWPDFWKAWKNNFGKSLAGGLLFALALGLFTLAAFVYYNIFGTSFLMVVIGAFTACLMIIVIVASFYFWPMVAFVDLPLKALLKNSLILVFGSWRRSIRAILVVLGAALILGFWPTDQYYYYALIVMILGFSVYSLCQSFAVYPAIYDRVIRKEEEEAASLATELHSKEALKWEDEAELRSASVADLDFGPDEEEENKE